VHGVVDITTGIDTSLNELIDLVWPEALKRYTEERFGDVKHIHQDTVQARNVLNFTADERLEDHVEDIKTYFLK
jgi:hypothetical protein